jgi:hypothetical protein
MRGYNKTSQEKDGVTNVLTQNIGKENFEKLQMDYDNESLDDLVKNSKTAERIIEYEGSLIQKIDPIFLDPPKNSFISAHFYAPRKRLFGQYVDTFWVNIIVIWTMSLGLAITLYFDVLKKLMDFFGDFSSKFSFLKKKKSV